MCEKNCCDCKFFNYDEYWDGEEEYGVFECEKGNYEHIGWHQEPCKDFEE